jgi:hypothetical protein
MGFNLFIKKNFLNMFKILLCINDIKKLKKKSARLQLKKLEQKQNFILNYLQI